jgi:mannitol/fructose-specific phosphotransferase system IIA component (Ntr-type)
MHIEELLNVDRITVNMAIGNRADAINALADSFASSSPQLTSARVAQALHQREQLASTNVGDGVAMPHARLPEVEGAQVAITICRDAVPFDAEAPEDGGEPVRILVGLLTDEGRPSRSLSALCTVATLLQSEEVRDKLRHAETPAGVLEVLTAAQDARAGRTWR